MSNKQFQYVSLMEARSIQENQALILEKLDKLLESDIHLTPECSEEIKKLNSFFDFDEEESKLEEKGYMKMKKLQLRSIGGRSVRNSVKNGLDAMLTRSLQQQFRKDGLKGKRAFVKTNHYKCLIGAIVDPAKDDFTKSSVDYLIGDLLKRTVKKVVVPNTPEHDFI
ncbi:uncharacterized protein LOC136082218 [Hydra vulgaris]|uniref:Uncharacterized protein LOC136082218 n=1 Tax=Hydra vulgaris TaxID=6087 RepID=A0ABM4C5F3_HYDVU